jgi:anti-sigma28 factor (negative regulator of flagellin synthesis)
MQISDAEAKRVLNGGRIVEEIVEIGEEIRRAEDQEIVERVTQDVLAMGDREDRIAELREKIESGTYKPTAEEIVEAMVKRSIVDRVR